MYIFLTIVLFIFFVILKLLYLWSNKTSYATDKMHSVYEMKYLFAFAF